jgi:glycosyltransferase involved in cell wall biosynthesis
MGYPLVSVVIPVFNSRDFLMKSLASVLAQSFRDFEIICVDDGSVDGSLALLQELSSQDARIIVLRQSHAGAGLARNLGISHASGKWIYFLDSDDWITPNCLSKLVAVADSAEADVVYFDATLPRIRPRKELLWWRRRLLARGVHQGRKYLLPAIRARAFVFSPCTQFVRRSVLVENKIRFPAQLIGEDVLFSIKVVLAAHKVAYLPRKLFHRNLRPGSITTGSGPIETIREFLISIDGIKILEERYAGDADVVKALGILRRRLRKSLVSEYRRLPAQVQESLTARNIALHPSDTADEFLAYARSSRRR